MTIQVSFVIPCLNEETTLPRVIEEIRHSYSSSPIEFEIIVADNGSTDRSVRIAEDYRVRVVHAKLRGYGSALRAGIIAARGEIVVIGDADGSYLFADAAKMIERCRRGSDLVVGDRFSGGIERDAMPFLHRYLGNPILSAVGRLFYSVDVRDMHCGLRAFNKEQIVSLGLSTTGMEFASEMIIQASRHNLRIEEVPVRLIKDLRDRPPHLNTWRDGWRHLRILFAFSPRWLFLVPGLLFLVLGLVVLTFSLFGSISIGRYTFGLRTAIVASTMMNFALVAAWSSRIANQIFAKRCYRRKFSTGVVGSISLGLSFIGAFLITKELLRWQSSGFGPLPISDSGFRFIGASLCFSVGVTSFFLSLLSGVLNFHHQLRIENTELLINDSGGESLR